jgi:hypothetical protein
MCNRSVYHGAQSVSPPGRTVTALQLSLLPACARSWGTSCCRVENNYYHQFGLSIQSPSTLAVASSPYQESFSRLVLKLNLSKYF